MSNAITSSDATLAYNEVKVKDDIFSGIVTKNMGIVKEDVRPSVIFKLRNPPNGKVHIDGIDDVFDEATGGTRRIRLLRGVNTIWMDEQEKVDKNFVDKNRMSITFIQGGIICDQVKDANIIKAARLMNGCEDNKNRIPGKKRSWYEWNPAAQEREAFERELFENEVVKLALDAPIATAKKHGLYLGCVFTDEQGRLRSDEGIKAIYVRKAKEQPKRFKDTFDTKEVEINYLIRAAILDAKIDITSKSGIKWATGGLICKLPHDRQPVEYLVDFAMLSTDESKAFLERLQSIAG
jgi:hypothetical protein